MNCIPTLQDGLEGELFKQLKKNAFVAIGKASVGVD